MLGGQQGATPEQNTSIPVQKDTTKEVQNQVSVAPVQQQTSTEVIEPPTSTEVQKPTSEPVEKQSSLPVQRQASEPAEKPTGKLIKASYYISEADDWKLEQIRIQRRRRGVKIDKSALIREAIGLLQE